MRTYLSQLARERRRPVWLPGVRGSQREGVHLGTLFGGLGHRQNGVTAILCGPIVYLVFSTLQIPGP